MTTPRAARGTLRALAVEALPERRLAQAREIGPEPHQDRLRLRVPEPAVELEYVGRAVGGDHDAGVEESRVRRAVGAEAGDRGLDDFAHDARVHACGHHRGG